MEEELISKKEILEQTGISYGQLYRWKRKALIPEDWFIKKSSYTGQETFFPEKQIIERINKILELKDTMPLDELADMFSNKTSIKEMNSENIVGSRLITNEVMSIFQNMMNKNEPYDSKDIMMMYVMQQQLDMGQINISEIEVMMNLIEKEFDKLQDKDGTVYMLRRLGVTICIAAFGSPIVVDNGCKIITKVNIKETMDNVKFKLSI